MSHVAPTTARSLPQWTLFPLFLVCAFETWVWSLDPYGVHAALNRTPQGSTDLGDSLFSNASNQRAVDEQSMPLWTRVMAICINSGSLLLLYVALRRRWAHTTAVLVPYLAMYCNLQTVFWWWPYLLGDAAGCHAMIAEHKSQLSQLPRLLPPRGANLVPDIEHTILFPLSVLALACVVRAYVSSVRASGGMDSAFLASRTLAWASALVGLVPLLFLRSADPRATLSKTLRTYARRERGPLLAAVSIWLLLSCVWSCCRAGGQSGGGLGVNRVNKRADESKEEEQVAADDVTGDSTEGDSNSTGEEEDGEEDEQEGMTVTAATTTTTVKRRR